MAAIIYVISVITIIFSVSEEEHIGPMCLIGFRHDPS